MYSITTMRNHAGKDESVTIFLIADAAAPFKGGVLVKIEDVVSIFYLDGGIHGNTLQAEAKRAFRTVVCKAPSGFLASAACVFLYVL